ncbi:MAG: T9SS type A sorting domain-containing protein [Flavobacteriales bacterium]|nr:T9SS type A sorting domain-containing protein [Flavobacteriales bacterium]
MVALVPLSVSAQTEVEPNNSTVQATPVTYNTAMAGSTGACSPTDNSVDYFSFTPPDQGVLRVQTAMSTTGGTPLSVTVQLRNSSGSLIETWTATAGANNTAVNETFTHLCTGLGVYYITVNNPSTTECTNYSITYDVLPPLYGADAEPNNSSVQAADTMAAGADHDGRIDFRYGDATDYCRILAPNDGVMTVAVSAEHAGGAAGTMTLRLRNNSTGTVETWTVNVGPGGAPSANTFTHYCTGTEQVYYLSFESPSDCGTSYRWSYTVQQPFHADDAEPNQSTVQAILASAGSDHDGRLSFDYDNNLDYYRLQAPNDGVLTMNIQAEHAGVSAGTFTARLRNSSGATIDTWMVNIGAGGAAQLNTFTHRCTGTEQVYYLSMETPDVCGVSYRFTYTVAEPLYADDAEPNESTVQAIVASAGTDYDGRLSFDYDNTTDYYRLQAPNDGVITVNISAEHSAADAGTLMARLRNSSGSQLMAWTVNIGPNGVAQSNTFTRNCTGTEQVYYLNLDGASVCGASYRFNYSVDAPVFADDTEPNNSTVQALLIDLNASAVPGRVNFEYDNTSDYFKVDHPGGILTVDIAAENAGAAGLMTVHIRNSAGSALATNSAAAVGANGVPATSTTATGTSVAAGTYYIEVVSTAVCGVSYSLNCYDDDNDGTCNAFDLCPGGPEPGTPCDDGDACTINDIIGAGCSCAGTFQDSDNDGTCDANDLCPGGPEPGTACDDLNACTIGDVIQSDCSCAGTFQDSDNDGVCDANDLCPGGPEPGTACDDGDPLTSGDVIQLDCSCAGELPCTPGATCDDGDACTTNDVYDGACNCAGTFQDSDNDGVCDSDDSCPNVTGQIGSPCNDGNPNTENDMLDASCQCMGTPIGGGCQFNEASLEIETDGVSTTLWEVRVQGTDALVASGGQLYPEGVFNESICLPDGCYYLVVTDDGGDGITGGGYVLRDEADQRIIDNAGNFSSGSISQIANGLGFCLPLGSDRLISNNCDKSDWTPTDYVVANDNPAVTAQYGVSNATSGYQLWWYNPNGGYSFRRYQSHSTSNGLAVSATRACHFRVNGWSGNQLQENVLYNVRVRSRVAGTFNEFGPACRFILNPLRAQCPLTHLNNTAGNQYFSCGATREWGNGNYVSAQPTKRILPGGGTQNANLYQFRFRLQEETFEVIRTSGTYHLQLNWITSPLMPGATYLVDVRASFDNGATWCSDFIQPSLDPWGPVCTLTIAGGAMNSLNLAHEGTEPARSAQLSMYPNPNRGDQLFINLTQVEDGVNTVSVDIYDGFGKRVATRTIAVQDGFVNTVLELNGELATGMYLVNITAGSTLHTERLVIQP